MPNAEPGVTSCPQWPPLCSLSLPSDWFQLFHVYPGQAELSPGDLALHGHCTS